MKLHIHVGHNVPGQLIMPESDVTCFGTAEDALEALRHGIKDLQDSYRERCSAKSADQQEKGSDCCPWCDVASDCETALSAIAEGDAMHLMRKHRDFAIRFEPPEGPAVRHWVIEIHEPRESCEIYAGRDGE